MAGIQSLMSQGPVPGQAPQQPMPGMMPKPGASTPPAQVKFLETLPSQKLKAMYDQQPSLALLSAYEKAVQREELDASMRGQQAMQQVANAPATIADAIMSRPVMAAHGGIMQGYAGGGAVAFQTGTSPRGLPFPASPSRIDMGGDVPIYAPGPDKEPGETEAEYHARKQKEAAEADEVSNRPLRRLYRYVAEKIRAPSPLAQMRAPAAQAAQAAAPARTTDTSSLFPFGVPESPMMDIPEIQVAPSPALPSAGSRRQTIAAPAPTPAVPTQGLQNLVDLEKAQKEELERIQGRQAVDPTVLAARKAEREGAEGIATGRQTRSQAQLTEAQRLRDEALQRSQGNIFSDPEALLRIASGIDTRKGRGIGSLAGGVADIMGQRRSEAAAARKDFQTAQNLHNQELNALDTLRQLQRERDTAIAAGDVTAARAIQDQITSVNRFYQKAKEDRQTAERNYQLDVIKTQATRDQAQAAITSANRPTEFQQKMDLFRTDPAAFEKMYGAKEKSSYDTINDNAQKKFSDWATSPKGMTASAEDRNAMWQEILNREIDTAKRFGIKTPEGAAGPTTGGTVDKNNPLLK